METLAFFGTLEADIELLPCAWSVLARRRSNGKYKHCVTTLVTMLSTVDQFVHCAGLSRRVPRRTVVIYKRHLVIAHEPSQMPLC